MTTSLGLALSFAFVAAAGIAFAAYYALRLYQHAMHNRKPDDVESREIGWRQGGVIAGLVACIVALALYPGLILHRADDAVSNTVTRTKCLKDAYYFEGTCPQLRAER